MNHPQVASEIILGLKDGYFIILQAQNIFKSPQVSAFPLLKARHRIQLFMTTFSAAESLVCNSVATAWLDLASAWSLRLFQIGKTEPWLMAGLWLNHGLTSQNGYGE